MEEVYFKKVVVAAIFAVLAVLSFILIKPILLSIIIAIILAFVFSPIYKWIHKKTRSKNFSATVLCVILILLIVLPLWFLTPIAIEQSFKIYQASQQVDFVSPLKKFFPSLFASEQFSSEIGSAIRTFVGNTTNSLVNSFGDLILKFPTLALQLLIVFFTFFFILRDGDDLINYIKSLSPFSKEIEDKFFESSKGITSSVIYGQVVVGILQGIIAGIGFFIFGVPNALLLTLVACAGGIIPIAGTVIVWVPVAGYLIVAGNTFAAAGIVIFGTISSSVDNLLRPIIISRRTHMHSSIILIGMIGGLFMFGILGLILGPLILAYLLILLELYRKKNIPGILIHPPTR